jgi:hypothetical protein
VVVHMYTAMQNTHEMPSRIESCQHHPRLPSAVQALVRHRDDRRRLDVQLDSPRDQAVFIADSPTRHSRRVPGCQKPLISRGCHAPFHQCESHMRERSEDKDSICARPIFH